MGMRDVVCWPAMRFSVLLFSGLLFSGGWAAVAVAEPDSAQSALDLAAEFDAIERPTIVAGRDLPATLRVGRAEIQPRAGSKLWILSAGGRDVGYVLEGPGRLVYRIEDRTSIPPARHNLKRVDGITVSQDEEAVVVSKELSGAAVWGWDIDFEDGAARPVTGREIPGWLRSTLDKKFWTDPARALLCTDRNGNPGYRWAFFHGPGDDLFLLADPRPSVQSEQLVRLRKARSSRLGQFSGKLYPERLARQPIGRSWWDAEPIEFASVDTEIEVENARGNHVRVTARTRLQTLRDGLRLLPMRLLDGNLDNSAGHWHEFRLVRLTLDGQPAAYVRRNFDLLVALPQSSKKGDSFLLEVEAEGDILDRPSGDNYWRLGGQAWYPKPGVGGQEWAEFRITAETRSPLVPRTGGEIVESTSVDGVNRVQTRLEGPMGYVMVVAGKYRTVTEDKDGARVHISTYAAVKETAARRVAQVILSTMDCLETWLGVPYPFQDLQVVEVQQWGWGQAPPGVIFITQEAFLTRASSKIDAETRIGAAVTSRGINERVAHEVAHAWFPHVSKVVRPSENWLSESLADYASAVCLQERMANPRKGKQAFDRQLRQWRTLSKEAGDATGIYLAHELTGGADDWSRWRALLYGRGPLALHAIRSELRRKHGQDKGDRMFFIWIRSYVQNFTFKAGGTPNLIAILNQISGEDWQPFFDRHIYGVEAPKID